MYVRSCSCAQLRVACFCVGVQLHVAHFGMNKCSIRSCQSETYDMSPTVDLLDLLWTQGALECVLEKAGAMVR